MAALGWAKVPMIARKNTAKSWAPFYAQELKLVTLRKEKKSMDSGMPSEEKLSTAPSKQWVFALDSTQDCSIYLTHKVTSS